VFGDFQAGGWRNHGGLALDQSQQGRNLGGRKTGKLRATENFALFGQYRFGNEQLNRTEGHQVDD
jgi:hypothetical protein